MGITQRPMLCPLIQMPKLHRPRLLRWKVSDGRILEWDYQHGAVEMYDKRGNHLG
ncbi:toxin, partial [Pseudomonas sp. FSL R10-0071]|nr:toxin [Pseudomonas sp. FSL R10-0071]